MSLKKIFAIYTSFAATLLLLACGGGGGDSSSSSTSTASSYTGKGSTVLNLDWATHTNSDTDSSSHQALTNSIILETAKDATLVPVTYPNTNNWLTSISSTIAGMSSGQILNLSAGVTGDAYGTLSIPSPTPNILISIAAGNGNETTLTSGIRSALYNSGYRNNLIFVGALRNGSIIGSTAGGAADRFVVADGACTGTAYYGTSCSAPRIAGYAAIIKQKYPNATGEQIASAILNTAVLQAGWDAATYGRGKADLNAALNYLGTAK